MKKVVIVGSGMGGLVAGNLLAQKGHKVTMFESHSMPGGYVAGFYRKGFYFESGTLSFEASASVNKAMKDIGVLEKVDFEKLRIRMVCEEFDGAPGNYEEYKEMFFSAFPSDKGKLDKAFSELDKMAGLLGDMDEPMPFLLSGFQMLRSMLPYILSGPKMMRLMKQYGNMTSSEFAGKYFEKGSRLFCLFRGYGYPDVPAIFLGTAFSGMFTDLWAVKGGMQSWADVLAENFRKLGGDLKLNSYVDKIVTKNGAAVGVSCQGTFYEADYVISAGDYKKTFLKLLDDQSLVPQALREKINNAPVCESFFTVYLGLDMPNEELCKYMKTSYVSLLDHKPGYNIYDSRDEDFFTKTCPTLFSPSMIDPKLAPDRKSSLMLQTIVPHRWMDNWGGGDEEVYRQLKEKAREAMIDSAARLIPGLKECIEYKDAATPLTYERFTHNTDGASSAWSWNPRKKFHKDAMSVNIVTPVKNLYIGSCWAMQIGGVPGTLAAAYQCAKKIR